MYWLKIYIDITLLYRNVQNNGLFLWVILSLIWLVIVFRTVLYFWPSLDFQHFWHYNINELWKYTIFFSACRFLDILPVSSNNMNIILYSFSQKSELWIVLMLPFTLWTNDEQRGKIPKTIKLQILTRQCNPLFFT